MFKALLQPLITCSKPQSTEEISPNRDIQPRSDRPESGAITAILSTATNKLTDPPRTPRRSDKTVTFADEHAFNTLAIMSALIERGKRTSLNSCPKGMRSGLPQKPQRQTGATNALNKQVSIDLTRMPFLLDHMGQSDQTSLQSLRTLTQVNRSLRATITQHSNKWKCINDIDKACKSLKASELPSVEAVLDAFSDEWTPEKLEDPKNKAQFQRILRQINEAETELREQQHEQRLLENQTPWGADDNGFRQWIDALVNLPTGRENRANIPFVWNRNETFGRAWCEAEYEIRKSNLAFNGLPEALRNNKALLMIALEESAHPIEHVGPDCKRDIDVMMKIARSHHFSWVKNHADVSIWHELLQRCAAENIPTR